MQRHYQQNGSRRAVRLVQAEAKLQYVTPAYSRRQLVVLPFRGTHERYLVIYSRTVDAFNSTLDFRVGRAAVQKLRPTVGSQA